MPTITAPILPDRSGPDLTGLDGYLSYTIDPGGETYTVTMPPDWRDPSVVAMWGLRAALDLSGLTPAVTAALDAMPGEEGVIARAGWANAATIRRDHPLVLALQAALQLDDETVDALWASAAQIAA